MALAKDISNENTETKLSESNNEQRVYTSMEQLIANKNNPFNYYFCYCDSIVCNFIN